MSNPHFDAFLATQRERDFSSATIKALQSDLKQFSTWWEQRHKRPFAIDQLVARDVRQWQRHRQQIDGVSPSTINRNLVSLRRFCQWAVEGQLLPDNPASDIDEISQDKLAPRFLPDEAIDVLLRAPRVEKNDRLRYRDQALLALLVYAGIRSQEACDLQLRDVDIDGGMLTIRRGKRKKARRIPLHSEAQLALIEYVENVRCLDGLPEIGSEMEREPFLVGLRRTVSGYPMQAGIKTRVVRKRLKHLGR